MHVKPPLYNRYSSYLKERYGEKVYKIPVNIPVTCPNRDGSKGFGGCVYCGGKGGGNETLSDQLSVSVQIEQNMRYIGKRYHAQKFIPYFQSFSNTYCALPDFMKWIHEAIGPDVVEIAISTRPDCISDEQLDFLKDIKSQEGVEITIELGLQTVNEDTLKILNRGHTLADYEETMVRIKAAGLLSCTHMILDLPWDEPEDIVKAAEIISEKGSDFVKCHSLYIEKNTILKAWYDEKSIVLRSKEDYILNAIAFLENLAPDIVIQRLIGRVPEADSVISNWHTSWWKIRDELEMRMEKDNHYQGKVFPMNDVQAGSPI